MSLITKVSDDIKLYEGTVSECINQCRKDRRLVMSLSDVASARYKFGFKEGFEQPIVVSDSVLYTPDERVYLVPPVFNPILKRPNAYARSVAENKGLWIEDSEMKLLKCNSRLINESWATSERGASLISYFTEDITEYMLGQIARRYGSKLKRNGVEGLKISFEEGADLVPYIRPMIFSLEEITDNFDEVDKEKVLLCGMKVK